MFVNIKKRLGQKCFSLSQTQTNLLLSVQICSGLLFIFESFDFSCFQRLIGVQDEDSCGKSSLCETCPAIGLRGKCHKSDRPWRQRTPSRPIRLMPTASERSPPLFYPQACRGGSRATRGKRSLARKSLAVWRTYFYCSSFYRGFLGLSQPLTYSINSSLIEN